VTPAELRVLTAVKDEDNAASLYLKAHELQASLDRTKMVAAKELVHERGSDTAGPVDKAKLRAAVAFFEPVLAVVEQASAKAGCDFKTEWELGTDAKHEESRWCKEFVEMLCAMAESLALDGKYSEAIRTLETATRVRVHLQATPHILAALSAIECDAIVCRRWRQIVRSNSKDSRVLELAERFAIGLPAPPLYRRAVAGEIVLLRAEIARKMAEDESRGPLSPVPNITNVVEAKLLEVERKIMESVPTQNDDWQGFRTACGKLERDLNAERSMLSDLLNPVGLYSARSFSMCESRHRLARIAVRLLIDRLKTGTLPAALESLGEAGIDPVDGKPYRYKRSGTGFVIYGVGYDGKDHGGRTKRKDSSDRGGFDLVIDFSSA